MHQRDARLSSREQKPLRQRLSKLSGGQLFREARRASKPYMHARRENKESMCAGIPGGACRWAGFELSRSNADAFPLLERIPFMSKVVLFVPT